MLSVFNDPTRLINVSGTNIITTTSGSTTATFAGNIALGANKLTTTNLVVKELDANTLDVRNSADDANRSVRMNLCRPAILASQNGTALITLAASSPHMAVTDARDFSFGTTTGTKFGTATNQKLAFYNATPVAQQTGIAVTAEGIHAALVNLGLITA